MERSSRFLLLAKLDAVDAETVAAALRGHIQALPGQLRRSLTWDHGKEMARHVQLTVDTGVQIYFCDPKSPWQRGSNENINGLLRQYFPKRSDLRPHSQHDLDAIAAELNGRPRQTLGFMTPSGKYTEVLRCPPEPRTAYTALGVRSEGYWAAFGRRPVSGEITSVATAGGLPPQPQPSG